MAVRCAIIGSGNIGIDGLRQLECYPGIGLAFDATSAKAPKCTTVSCGPTARR